MSLSAYQVNESKKKQQKLTETDLVFFLFFTEPSDKIFFLRSSYTLCDFTKLCGKFHTI